MQGAEPSCQGSQQDPISSFIKLNIFGRTFAFWGGSSLGTRLLTAAKLEVGMWEKALGTCT